MEGLDVLWKYCFIMIQVSTTTSPFWLLLFLVPPLLDIELHTIPLSVFCYLSLIPYCTNFPVLKPLARLELHQQYLLDLACIHVTWFTYKSHTQIMLLVVTIIHIFSSIVVPFLDSLVQILQSCLLFPMERMYSM